LLEKEHEGFRHFCRSEFDAKDALLIQAIFPREKCGEVDDGEGAGETEGNWVVGRDLCERLLEMPAKQDMCSFDQVNFFLPPFSLFSRPVKKTKYIISRKFDRNCFPADVDDIIADGLQLFCSDKIHNLNLCLSFTKNGLMDLLT